MLAIAQNLETIMKNYISRLQSLPAAVYTEKPLPEKWSKKEILGHLVDSALNNSRRFVVAQYEDNPGIVYNQDYWVKLTNYQEYPLDQLISFWLQLNQHIVHILIHMSEENAARKCTMGGEPVTLKWCAADYCHHLLHHLHQILDMEPVAYG